MADLTVTLDLEGTLIRDQLDPLPRPGLYDFLETLASIGARIVMMTTVPEIKFKTIAAALVDQGAAPAWFTEAESISWKEALQEPQIYKWPQTWPDIFDR